METKKLSALQELVVEVERKAIPSLIRYVKEFEENIIVIDHKDKLPLFTIVYKDYFHDYYNFDNEQIIPIKWSSAYEHSSIDSFLHDCELSKDNFWSLHWNSFDRLKSIIKTAEHWHEKYIEINNLMDICDKVDIKIATRELLFEKYQKN